MAQNPDHFPVRFPHTVHTQPRKSRPTRKPWWSCWPYWAGPCFDECVVLFRNTRHSVTLALTLSHLLLPIIMCSVTREIGFMQIPIYRALLTLYCTSNYYYTLPEVTSVACIWRRLERHIIMYLHHIYIY